MNKNLRVNSKTTIAEFKRKHNWLVENSAIQLNVSDIKNLSNEDIENLKCGDIVNKVDSSGKHAYVVSFKNDTGICLTYVDASCIETQSYDKVDGNWVYNSQDLLQIPLPENSDSGKVLGVSANGKYELKEISGGIKLYKHDLRMNYTSTVVRISFITTSNEPINNLSKLYNALYKGLDMKEISDNGGSFMRPLVLNPNEYSKVFIQYTHISTTYPGGNIGCSVKSLDLSTGEYSSSYREITSNFAFNDTITEL